MIHFLSVTVAKAFLVLSLASTPAQIDPIPSPGFTSSIYVTSTNKVRLAIEKASPQALTIMLRPVGDQTILLSRRIGRNQSKAALQLDVDQLADGAYELEIKSAKGSMIKQINLGTPTPIAQRLLAVY